METCDLISVVDGDRISVGLRHGFRRDAELYEKLEKDLEADWKAKHNLTVEERVQNNFHTGDHVLVKESPETGDKGFRRGVIQGVMKNCAPVAEYFYDVFLYDHGKSLLGYDESCVMFLKDERKQALAPRTTIVLLPGLVPAKLVVDLSKESVGDHENAMVCIQTGEWSRKTKTNMTKWLRGDKVDRLYVELIKTNADGSVYGDIWKKTRSGNNPESLSKMMVAEHFALESESLLESQLRPSVTKSPAKTTVRKSSKVDLPPPKNYATKTVEFVNPRTNFETSSSTSSSTSSTYSQVDEDVKRGWGVEHGIDIPGRLLVRGSLVRKAYSKIEEFRLDSRIVLGLSAIGSSTLSHLQGAIGPNYIRGSDIILISPDGGDASGKNSRLIAYLLPLLRVIFDQYTTKTKFDDCSPQVLIVCQSHETGGRLEGTILASLSSVQHLPIQAKFLGRDDSRRRLPNGISILITTVEYLNGLLHSRDAQKLFRRMRYIIFEEVEQYVAKSWDDLVGFMTTVKSLGETDAIPFQLTLSGSRWSENIEKLYRSLTRNNRAPSLFISALNEVIQFARIRWDVHHVQEHDRIKDLIKLIKDSCSEHARVVIACSTPSVANSVQSSLGAEGGIQSMVATMDVALDDLRTVREYWRKSDKAILVISDDMIRVLDVTTATCMINFDSPQLQSVDGVRRQIMAERFGYMWSNVRNFQRKEPDVESSSDVVVGLESHFLMTGQEHNFFRLYKFAKRLGDLVHFHPRLVELAKELELEGESTPDMCDGIKLFGFCTDPEPNTCPKSHHFTKRDLMEITAAPTHGEVELRIMSCESPSVFRARLLRHFVFEGGKRICNTSYINELSRRHALLTKFYSHDKNRCKVQSWSGSPLCAVLDPESEKYTRAKVINILTHDKQGLPKDVRVSCVDTGHTLNPAAENVFVLGSEFTEWPVLSVEVVLGDLKPVKGEIEYRPYHKKNAKKLTCEKIYNAKICISVRDTLWVNPMVEYHVDPITKRSVKGASVRQSFFSDHLAVNNSVHLKYLTESVMRFGDLYKGHQNIAKFSSKPERDELAELMKEFHQLGDECRWAFVELSGEHKFDPAKIATTFGRDPWTFYGVHVKYEDQLKDLEKELNICVETNISERFQNHEKMLLEFYHVGMAVAVKERGDGVWMRAILLEKYEVEGKPVFDVFFVDYGDYAYQMSANEVFPLPRVLAKKLPFQAIAFKLDHVQPVGGGQHWEQAEMEAFLDLIIPNERSVDLELAAMDKLDSSELRVQCHYYDAVAILGEKELGNILVEKSLAEFKPGCEEIGTKFKDFLLKFYEATISQAIDQGDDDDDNESQDALEFNEGEDDFDVGIGGMSPDEIIQGTLGMNFNNSVRNRFKALAESSRDRPDGGNQLDKPAEHQSSSKPVETIEHSVPQQQLPRSSDGPPVLHPQVVWRQTDNKLVLTVKLPDIREDFDLKLGADKQTVVFKSVKPENYSFALRLYGKVLPNFETNLTGQRLAITFFKRMKGVMWVRVLYDKNEKFMWLKQDMEYFHDDDDEEEEAGSNDRDEECDYRRFCNMDTDDDVEEDADVLDDDEEEDDDDEGWNEGGVFVP